MGLSSLIAIRMRLTTLAFVSTVLAAVAVYLAESKPTRSHTRPKPLEVEDNIKPYNTGPVTFNVEISNSELDVNTKSDSTEEEERDEPAPTSSRGGYGYGYNRCVCPDCCEGWKCAGIKFEQAQCHRAPNGFIIVG